jgi:hypothetical protein
MPSRLQIGHSAWGFNDGVRHREHAVGVNQAASWHLSLTDPKPPLFDRRNEGQFSMARTGFSRGCFLLGVLFCSLAAFSENDDGLPDAPVAHVIERGYTAVFKGISVVDRSDPVQPLNADEKMVYWLREEASPGSMFTTFASAGFEQWVDTDPKYGSDSGAFGERLGAAALRGASMRFFSDSLLPTITHEDPRYFRMAHGRKGLRGLYAAERVFVTRRDDGSESFNYSAVAGHAMASALTMAYYPSPSANAGVAARTFGVSLAGLAGGHLFTEFWPDVRVRVFRRHGESGAD